MRVGDRVGRFDAQEQNRAARPAQNMMEPHQKCAISCHFLLCFETGGRGGRM